MYTFGGATSHRTTFTPVNNLFGASRTTLICITARPTTLTAGRCYWGASTVTRLAVDTTTSALRLTLDAATTDGVYTSASGLITTNTYQFIAVLISQNAGGGTAAVRMWVGSGGAPPKEVTVTETTGPSGAWVASGTTFDLGNTNGSNLSLQGAAGGLVILSEDSSDLGRSVLGFDTPGTLPAESVPAIFHNAIMPIYRGDVAELLHRVPTVRSPAGNLHGLISACSCTDVINSTIAYQLNAANRPTIFFPTGATASTLRILGKWETHWDAPFGMAPRHRKNSGTMQ
jgi:hypothetical protein